MRTLTVSAIVTLALLVCGCSEKYQTTPAQSDRASAVTVPCDSLVSYFTDFFPAGSTFTDLQPGAGITLHSVDKSTFTLSTSVPLSTLKLKVDGEPATLVVEDTRNFKRDYWNFIESLYTTGYDAQHNTISIGCSGAVPQTVVALWQNIQLPSESVTLEGNTIVVKLPEVSSHAKRRTYLRVYAATKERPMSDILVLLDNGKPVMGTDQLTRHDPETQILYSLMIDRFCNGNTANDWQYNRPDEVLPQADYQGGDIAGVTQKIEEGFFDSLGINTIWISPITQNPYDVWGQYDHPKTRFTGYHGYWPIYITKVEERFSTDQELHRMLHVAHSHNMNVVLDYVANHLHINSPLFQAHPEWATDSITPDGRRNFELWDEFRLTTWFDVHIPSLNYEMQEVADQLTDSALFWVKEFEFDGFRHDACKHIPLNYWRTLTRKMKTDPQLRNRDLWMIGETYGDADLIGSYIKTGMLNAQFDFNIYHTALNALGGNGNDNMRNIAGAVNESQWAYGAHHTMGNISGNHDKARFVSLAGGDLKWDEDAKYAGWNRHVGVGDSVRGYAKQLMLNKLNLTLPGVPCIYQGDEYGQEGGNDPDNRRFMRFGGYNRFEQHNLEEVRKMAQERRNNIILQLGDYVLLRVTEQQYVFLRVYMGEALLVAFNNDSQPAILDVDLPAGIRHGESHCTVHIAGNDVTIIKL